MGFFLCCPTFSLKWYCVFQKVVGIFFVLCFVYGGTAVLQHLF